MISKKKSNRKSQNKTLRKSIKNKTKMPDYIEHLSEPWFSLMNLGLKTVEGRKNKGKWKDMKIGEIIEWYNSDFLERKFTTRVIGKSTYSTFREYLENEGLDRCLPGINPDYGMEHALSVYYKYFTKEDEVEYGVVAIRLEKI
jgi:ASC-1-like (ASCH) protein